MKDRKDIWSTPGKGGGIPEAQLQAYLSGRLSDAERHEVEEWLSEEGMESDALEGLQELQPGEAAALADQLKKSIRVQASLRSRSRRKRNTGEGKWGWLAVLLILVCCVLAYMVIRLFPG